MYFQFLETSLQKQHKLVTKFSGYRDQVKLKFRDHPWYSQDKEEQFVDILTEVEPFYQYFFGSFIETMKKAVLEMSEDHKRRANSELTWGTVCCRTRDRFKQLCSFPMKLIYHTDLKHSKPRQAVLKTPLLVSLQIDNLNLEWNKASLVIPYEIELTSPATTKHLVLVQSLAQQSQWNQFVAGWTSQINEALRKEDEDATIAIMYDISEKREKLILSLIQVMTNYNRYQQHHRKRCNNHHFIREAMETLGIQPPPAFSKTLKSHLQTFAPNTILAEKHFPTHYDLDLYLFENIGDKMIENSDLEFLVSKYFMFHMENRKGKHVNEWTCTEPSCQLLDLLKKL